MKKYFLFLLFTSLITSFLFAEEGAENVETAAAKSERIAHLRSTITDYFMFLKLEGSLENAKRKLDYTEESKKETENFLKTIIPNFDSVLAAYIEDVKDNHNVFLSQGEKYNIWHFIEYQKEKNRNERIKLPREMENLARPGDLEEIKDLILFSDSRNDSSSVNLFPNLLISKISAFENASTGPKGLDNLSSFTRLFQKWTTPDDLPKIKKEIDRLLISYNRTDNTESHREGVTINSLVGILRAHINHPVVNKYLSDEMHNSRKIYFSVLDILSFDEPPLVMTNQIFDQLISQDALQDAFFDPYRIGWTPKTEDVIKTLTHLYKTWPEDEVMKAKARLLLANILKYQINEPRIGLNYVYHYPLVELLLCRPGYLEPRPEECDIILAKLKKYRDEQLRPGSITKDYFLSLMRDVLERNGFSDEEIEIQVNDGPRASKIRVDPAPQSEGSSPGRPATRE